MPIAFRVTHEERDALVALAGRDGLGKFIRDQLPIDLRRRRRAIEPARHSAHFASVLAELGQSELSATLHELLEAVHLGAMPVTPETEALIRDACYAVLSMREALVHALGIREVDGE